jgi:hypothetical protein
MKLSGDSRRRAAYDACLVLNQAINELSIPLKVMKVSKTDFEAKFSGVGDEVPSINRDSIAEVVDALVKTVNFAELAYAVQQHRGTLSMALTASILNVYRLRETRDHILFGWLFTDQELRDYGLPPLQEFIGNETKWKNFEIIRHNMAGHSMIRRSTKSKPGKIIPAELLSTAVRKAGLNDSRGFVTRVSEELTPGVIKVRDELAQEYPDVKHYLHYYQTEYDVFQMRLDET